MLYIYCPDFGEYRSQEEFHPAGEAHIARPLDPDACTDQEWGEYLFFRNNTRGIHHELWVHSAGTRRFFNVVRDTVSYQILEVYPIGTQPDQYVKKTVIQGEPA